MIARVFTTRARVLGALSIFTLAVIAALLWSFSSFRPAGSEPTKVAAVQQSRQGDNAESVDLTEKQVGAIKIETAAEHEFVTVKTAVGTIDFNENMLVQVFPQYPGKILQAFYNLGDDVKKGDILFTTDSPDLLQAESSLLSTSAVLELTSRTLARASQLVKAGGGAQKDLDQATSDQQAAEGNFKAAKDAVRIFGKTDDEINQILEKRKVESTLVVPCPITGKVVARSAAPGFLVQPGNAPAPYTVADTSTMWMLANVIEADAPAYKVGQDVEVRVPAYPDKVFRGHVTTVGATIDPNTHRQLVRSEVADPDHLLRSGMFASFVIRVGDPMPSAAMPVESVVREGDGTMTVWVTTDRRHFVKRVVKVGIQNQDGLSQILDGLQPGELAVSEGAVFLSNMLSLGNQG